MFQVILRIFLNIPPKILLKIVDVVHKCIYVLLKKKLAMISMFANAQTKIILKVVVASLIC
jgi:hypothetical protein